MKTKLAIHFGILCFGSCLAIADNFTVFLETNSPGGLAELYDVNGSRTGNFRLPVGIEEVDIDWDSVRDYYRVQYDFETNPGVYSVVSEGYQFTNLVEFSSPIVGIPFEAFNPNLSGPPVSSGGNDGQVTGNFDIQGNLMNLGTPYADYNPGVQFKYAPHSNNFDISLARYWSVPGSELAKMTWSFPGSNSSDLEAVMTLTSNGGLYIKGALIPTQGRIEAGLLNSLRMYGNVTAAAGSVASGHQSSATGLYSFASGLYATANTYGMAAFGRYNLIPTGSLTGWTATDDLFVIGNGSSSTNRSNAVTIKKDGTTSLHGSVFIGTPNAGSLSFLGGAGQRSLSVGMATTGTDLLIAAGGASSLDNSGGTLILSGGAVQAGGAETAGSSILFKTADTNNGGAPTTRMSVDVGGNVIIGATAAALIGQKGQLVIGSHNVAQPGSFVIGAGNGVSGDPRERRNALRVREDGAVLVRPSGDIDMGEFDAGEQP